MKNMKRLLAVVLALVMCLSCLTGLSFADKHSLSERDEQTGSEQAAKGLAPKTTSLRAPDVYRYADDEIVRAIVLLEGEAPAELPEAQRAAAATRLAAQHSTLRNALSRAGVSYTVEFEYDSLLNGLAINVAYGDLSKVAALDGVKAVHIANHYATPVVTPATRMASSNVMTGTNLLQSAGFNGDGMVIAVLDTGITPGHEAFKVYGDILKDAALSEESAKTFIEGKGYGTYLSEKIPFAYDYYDQDNDATDDKSGHGTHVSGIAAGYAETAEGEVSFCGTAPHAQILAMKIFSSGAENGTSSDVYFAALEDAYELNADVINMSIGAQNGFTYDTELENEVFGNIYDTLEKNGIICSVAGGNEYSMAYYSSGWAGNGYVTSDYADYGVVGSPSTYDGNLSVASVENAEFPGYVLEAAGRQIPYYDSEGTQFFEALGGKEDVDYVAINGYGTPEDYKGVDVKGKIALVSRGEITFQEKVLYAADAGALALLVYNNQPGTILMSIDNYAVPAASITQEDGQYLLSLVRKDNPFTDVKEGDWFYDSVLWAVGAGVTTGTGDGTTFSPEAPCTRAQVVTFLYRAFNGQKVENPTTEFTDVEAGSWYEEAVNWAAENNITTGTGKGLFSPNAVCTRAQVVTFLYRASGDEVKAGKSEFTDVADGSWYADAVAWAVENDVTTGTGNGKFSPDVNCSRSQIVTLLYRALKPVSGGTVSFPDAMVTLENPNGWLTSDFSSWGCTPSLTLKPQLAGIGGNVYSASFNTTDGYELMSGTSMATPNVTGMMANISQLLDTLFEGLTKAERAELAEKFAQSTATLLADADGYLYSPRKQGAGLASMYGLASASAYITEPICNLFDNKDGEFEIKFTVKDLSGEGATYQLTPVVMYDYVQAADLDKDETPELYNTLTSDYLATESYEYDGTTYPADVDVTAPETVTVPAGGSVDVTVTLKLTDATKEYLDELFPNGTYIEGFVLLDAVEGEGETAEVTEEIHATFLGFYGDWNKAPVFEQHDWREIVDDQTQLETTEADDEGNTYADYGYTYLDIADFQVTTDVNTAYALNYSYLAGETDDLHLIFAGDNPMAYAAYNDAHITISNAEGATFDTLFMAPYALRNSRHTIMVVTDAETGAVYAVEDTEYLPKAYYDYERGYWSSTGQFLFSGTDLDGNALPDGTKFNVNFYANTVYGEDELGKLIGEDKDYSKLLDGAKDFAEWSFSGTVDNSAPEVLSYEFDKEKSELTVTAKDTQFLSAIAVTDLDYNILGIAGFSEEEAGAEVTVTLPLELGDERMVHIIPIDYAYNMGIEENVVLLPGEATVRFHHPEGSTLTSLSDEYTAQVGDTITLPSVEGGNREGDFIGWIPFAQDELTMLTDEIYDAYLESDGEAIVSKDADYYALYEVEVDPMPANLELAQDIQGLEDYEGTWAINGYDGTLPEDDTESPVNYMLLADLSAAPEDDNTYITYYIDWDLLAVVYLMMNATDEMLFDVEAVEGGYTFKTLTEQQYLTVKDGALTLTAEAGEGSVWTIGYDEEAYCNLVKNGDLALVFEGESKSFKLVDATAEDFALGEDCNLYLFGETSDYMYTTNPGEATLDTSDLEYVLSVLKTFEAEDYTEESFAALTEAIALAEEVLADENKTQDDVDTALDLLYEAYEALEEVGGGSEEPITGSAFVKVTDNADLTDGTYLIVYEAEGFALDGSLEKMDAVEDYVEVTISGNAIAATEALKASAFTVNVTDGTIQNAAGKYIGRTSDANGMEESTEALANTISIDEEGNAVILSSGGAYLRFNNADNQLRFRYYKSATYTNQQTIALYKLVEAD